MKLEDTGEARDLNESIQQLSINELQDGKLENDQVCDSTTCVLVLGMAGSGKTTFLDQVSKQCNDAVFVNLDPAVVGTLPYNCQIDIRNSVNYRDVMRNYKLGPNGSILTCLNLFATRIYDMIKLIREKKPTIVFVDTPGQIEVFTWSASGSIILDSLASEMPTTIAYIVDVPRCTSNAITFISNMMYACSVMYRSKLPIITILNKNDIVHHQQILDWISNFDDFQQALDRQESVDQNYAYSLARSLSLALDEFYNLLKAVGFSSLTGNGWTEVQDAIQHARNEYINDFLPYYEKLKKSTKERNEQMGSSNVHIGTPSYFQPSSDK
ncbi:hypothetical protein GJ496_009093 [Pomphorhynchus laevis]|nr:hypothetical protein GJ496_009093 [Pomphorhynchus laevis]